MIRFFDMDMFHGKQGTGSVRLRVDNLIKYWPEASKYKYGTNPDILIFQKVYSTFDWDFPKRYQGIKILDICDIDWTTSPDFFVKQTCDEMDAIVCPTKPLQRFLQQITTTPVKVIKDRFDLSEFPKAKIHKGKAKSAVWFGYLQNAELLKFAVPALEKRGLKLTVISNDNPFADRWGSKEFEKNYRYIKYSQETIYQDLQKSDICILPKGFRPQDKFKSNNKTIIAKLCGLPVARFAEDLDPLIEADERNKVLDEIETLKHEYNVHRSIEEYKELIEEIKK